METKCLGNFGLKGDEQSGHCRILCNEKAFFFIQVTQYYQGNKIRGVMVD